MDLILPALTRRPSLVTGCHSFSSFLLAPRRAPRRPRPLSPRPRSPPRSVEHIHQHYVLYLRICGRVKRTTAGCESSSCCVGHFEYMGLEGVVDLVKMRNRSALRCFRGLFLCGNSEKFSRTLASVCANQDEDPPYRRLCGVRLRRPPAFWQPSLATI